MTRLKAFRVTLCVHCLYDGSVQAETEDDAIARTYHIWRTECPHPFERIEDDELHHVVAEEITS